MLANLSVLVVDDEPDLCEIVRRVLTREGATVYTALGVTGARKVCEDYGQQVDLVITDLRLDDGTGVQVAEAVREVRPNAIVLYMSGLPYFDASVEEVRADGPVVAKPFKGSELVDAVQAVLTQADHPAPSS